MNSTKEIMRKSLRENNKFSIETYQVFITCLFVQAFIQINKKYGERYFTVEEFYGLFNQRATIPYMLNINDFYFIIKAMEHTPIIEENRSKKGEYRLRDISGDKGLMNI